MARSHATGDTPSRRKKPESKNPKAEKVCPVCERPFHWRARWKLNWESVVYCSKRCAGQKNKQKQD